MLTPNIRTQVKIPISTLLEYAKKMVELNIVSRIAERSDDLESMNYEVAMLDNDTKMVVIDVRATRRIGLDPANPQDSVMETVAGVRGRPSDATIARRISQDYARRNRPLPLP